MLSASSGVRSHQCRHLPSPIRSLASTFQGSVDLWADLTALSVGGSGASPEPGRGRPESLRNGVSSHATGGHPLCRHGARCLQTLKHQGEDLGAIGIDRVFKHDDDDGRRKTNANEQRTMSGRTSDQGRRWKRNPHSTYLVSSANFVANLGGNSCAPLGGCTARTSRRSRVQHFLRDWIRISALRDGAGRSVHRSTF